MVCMLQVNRRQAQADVVATEYAELQQAHSNLQNELLESQHQVQSLQAEVRLTSNIRHI
jgi:multidrug resistance efflux pump